MTFFNRVIIVSIMGVVGLATSGCVSVLPKPKPAPTVYRLSIPTDIAAKTVSRTTVINIEFPHAPRALSGTDIVLSPDGRRLTAAGGASWAEPVPSQIRHILIDTLANGGQITGVIPKGGTRVPYRLNIEIRRFEAVFSKGEDTAPNALVHLNLTLTDVKSRKLIGTHSVRANSWAATKSVSSIVAAQDNATKKAMDDSAKWLQDLIDGRRS